MPSWCNNSAFCYRRLYMTEQATLRFGTFIVSRIVGLEVMHVTIEISNDFHFLQAASKPTSICVLLHNLSLCTTKDLETLSVDQGLFPFWRRTFSLAVWIEDSALKLRNSSWLFEVLAMSNGCYTTLLPPITIPANNWAPLYLNIFRRKPAMTTFV